MSASIAVVQRWLENEDDKMEKAYWKCPDGELPKDALFVVNSIVNGFSLVLNLGLLVLLFLLTGRARLFLVHLRALIAAAVLYSFIEICNRIIPHKLFPTDSIVAPALCHIWQSNYLSIASFTFGALILNFIVGNRTIQIVCRYQHSFSTSLLADLSYVVGMALVSLVVMLPQAYMVLWDGNHCGCRDKNPSNGLLLFLYTEVFVRFGLTAVISVVVLSISCYKIIHWVRTTPAEQLFDTWNTLAFSSTTKEQMEAFSRPQGWMTATLCTVPLSADFLVASIYEAGHEFVCAVGLCKVTPASPQSRAGQLLVNLQLCTLPVIIVFYIPALRDLTVRVYQRLVSLSRERCRGTPSGEEDFNTP
ncbi:hypothetical protein SprV_0401491100 [Sparganum proliferum]